MNEQPPRVDGAPAAAQHRRHLARGFNWLGSAMIVAKIVDFSTIIVILLYLTQRQVGIGALVLSFAMMIEAFDGLGTGDAIVQAPDLARRQLDGLFWYVIGIAVLIGGIVLLAAPWLQAFYAVPGMARYFLAVALKQPLVGAAVVPLALLNRELRYERIAIVNIAATIGAALTRLGIALLGGGTWALVAGFVASGAFTLAGSLCARPFLPGWRCSFAEIRPLVRFGLRSATAHVSDQIFKNVHYLLVGWFYGPTPLALYRVVFDIAMEAAMAVGSLVNRTALPIFARLAGTPGQLKAAVLWSLQRLATVVCPFMVALMLLAAPLTALLHDSHGHSYAAGALPLQILAAAGILRVTSQLIAPVLLASGRPGTAAWFSTAALLLLSAGIVAAGTIFPAPGGLVAMACVWLAVYPPLIAWNVRYLGRHWGITIGELLRPFRVAVVAIAAMLALTAALGLLPLRHAPAFRIASVIIAMLLTYAGLFLHARTRPPAGA